MTAGLSGVKPCQSGASGPSLRKRVNYPGSGGWIHLLRHVRRTVSHRSVLVDYAFLHHESDVLKGSDVL